jgi:hypothetical protein
MMMSSADSSGRSWVRVCSTMPAGTMIQMARGVSSLLTKSARLSAPCAPSASSALTASEFTS